MTALIRSEALRLRTLRSTWAVLATVLAVGVAIAGGGMADAGGKDMTTPGQLREPVMVGVGLLAAVILAGFAAIHAGGEYRYQTITQLSQYIIDQSPWIFLENPPALTGVRKELKNWSILPNQTFLFWNSYIDSSGS